VEAHQRLARIALDERARLPVGERPEGDLACGYVAADYPVRGSRGTSDHGVPLVDYRDGVVLHGTSRARARGASGRPGLLRRDASSHGALVSMMQSTNLGQLDDPAQCGTLHRPGLRRIAHQ